MSITTKISRTKQINEDGQHVLQVTLPASVEVRMGDGHPATIYLDRNAMAELELAFADWRLAAAAFETP